MAGLLFDAPGGCDCLAGRARRWGRCRTLAPHGLRLPGGAQPERMLQGEEPAPADTDLDALRQSATVAAARHFRPAARRAKLAAGLTARLARLKLLEEQFCQQLELEKLESMAEASRPGPVTRSTIRTARSSPGRAQLLLRDDAPPGCRRESAR